MSHARMFSLDPRLPHLSVEYPNAWGGAAFIWGAVAEKHLGITLAQVMTNLAQGEDRIWQLVSSENISLTDRVCLALTFDHCYVEAQDITSTATCLREFKREHHEHGNTACHLGDWAEDMGKLKRLGAQVLAFHHTSVSRNPWVEYPEPCRHDPDPEPRYLGPGAGTSLATYIPEIRNPVEGM